MTTAEFIGSDIDFQSKEVIVRVAVPFGDRRVYLNLPIPYPSNGDTVWTEGRRAFRQFADVMAKSSLDDPN